MFEGILAENICLLTYQAAVAMQRDAGNEGAGSLA